jgi:hypothetical protein
VKRYTKLIRSQGVSGHPIFDGVIIPICAPVQNASGESVPAATPVPAKKVKPKKDLGVDTVVSEFSAQTVPHKKKSRTIKVVDSDSSIDPPPTRPLKRAKASSPQNDHQVSIFFSANAIELTPRRSAWTRL